MRRKLAESALGLGHGVDLLEQIIEDERLDNLRGGAGLLDSLCLPQARDRLLRAVSGGIFSPENLDPQVPLGWERRESRACGLYYFRGTAETGLPEPQQPHFLWPSEAEQPLRWQDLLEPPGPVAARPREGQARYIAYGDDGEACCLLCEDALGCSATTLHLTSPLHQDRLQSWEGMCVALRQLRADAEQVARGSGKTKQTNKTYKTTVKAIEHNKKGRAGLRGLRCERPAPRVARRAAPVAAEPPGSGLCGLLVARRQAGAAAGGRLHDAPAAGRPRADGGARPAARGRRGVPDAEARP